MNIIASIHREVKNPIDILEVYEEYRAGRIDRLPQWFLKGTDGLCNAVLVMIHACEQYNVEFNLINDEIIREMKLEPIVDRFGSMENMLDLYSEMIMVE